MTTSDRETKYDCFFCGAKLHYRNFSEGILRGGNLYCPNGEEAKHPDSKDRTCLVCGGSLTLQGQSGVTGSTTTWFCINSDCAVNTNE